MNITSKERVDILPGTKREVKVNEDIPSTDSDAVTLSNDGYAVAEMHENYVVIENNTKRTYSVFPGDVVAELGAVAEMSVSEVEEVFTENEDGVIECPLCGKEYKSESWFNKHMEDEHGTQI